MVRNANVHDHAGATTWWQQLDPVWKAVAVIVACIGLGSFLVGFANQYATRTYVDTAVAAHAAAPTHPTGEQRLRSLEDWRVQHEAQHVADTYWIKSSLRMLLEHQGLPAPPEEPRIAPQP